MKNKVNEVKKRILVSVIIPTYNTEYYMLKEAIKSVLNQTYQEFEIILIDDKSDKYSDFSFLGKYQDNRIRFYQCDENRGLAYCINWGIELSRGKYIAKLDADDIALPRKLEEQVGYFEKNKDANVLVSRGIAFGERCFVAGAIPSNSEFIKTGFLLNCGIVHSSVMFRKKYLLDNSIRYDVDFKKAQDYDLWTRICERGDEIHMLKKCLCLYRIHSGQASDYNVSKGQKFDAVKIKRRVLSDLYKPTDRDFLCQESLGFKKLVKGVSVRDIHKWMNKTIAVNKKVKKYDEKYLKLLLVYKYCSIWRDKVSFRDIGFMLCKYPIEMIWMVGILIYKVTLKRFYMRYIPRKYR